jgi:hypothetical protein
VRFLIAGTFKATNRGFTLKIYILMCIPVTVDFGGGGNMFVLVAN